MNNAGDNTNIHAAATGRFASVDEVIQNFYCEPYKFYESSLGANAKNRSKKLSFKNLFLYFFLTFVVILLLIPFQHINSINFPFFIFKDLIVILLLSVFLIYKRKNKYKTNKNKYISNVPAKQIFTGKNNYINFDKNKLNNSDKFNNKYDNKYDNLDNNLYAHQNTGSNNHRLIFNNPERFDSSNNQFIYSADGIFDYSKINYFRLGILDVDNYYNSYTDYNNYNNNNDDYRNHNNNDNDGNNKKNRLIIGIDRKKRFEHIMVVSPTGGGKTSKYIIPSIRKDACFKNTCVYAIDIDGPYLYNAVKDSWVAANKKIVHFDPYNAGSVHFNPLIERCGGGCGNEKNNVYNNENIKEIVKPASDDKLYELSSMIFYADNNELKGGDIQAHKYYSKRSADILYGCLLYLKCKYDIKYFNLITAKKFFEKGFSFIEKEIKSYDGNNNKKIKEIFNNFFEIPSYERAKIITDILNGLDFIKNANVENAFKTPEKILLDDNFLTIKDLFDKNNDTLLIVSVPKEKINSGGSRLISIITDMVIKAIYENRREILKNNSASNGNNNGDKEQSEETNIKTEIKSDAKSENNYNDHIYKDIFIYLDEFPVLNINNFDIELANLRKTGTGVCISLQDISFLKNKYGDISLIDSNIGTHIIMGNAGIDTAKRYSEKMGQKYVIHTEKFNIISGGGKYGKGPYDKKFDDILTAIGLNRKRETPVASGLFPLMNADEIKNMDINDVLIYSKFTRPFILSLS